MHLFSDPDFTSVVLNITYKTVWKKKKKKTESKNDQ